MVSRGASPAGGDPRATTDDSVPDIGRLLAHARAQAGLSLPEAALRVGATSAELEALESGTVGRMADRVETLRTLRDYADSLDLPGERFVLTLVDLWPSLDLPARNGDTGVVPVTSVTAAPVGGHSPAGSFGSAFVTGANEAAVTGVVGSINDTRQVPVFETGQVAAIRQSAPTYLKVLVAMAAALVVVGGIGLGLHNQISRWIHSAQSTTSRLISEAQRDTGVSSSPPAKADHHGAVPPKVSVVTAPGAQAATIDVAAPSFSVDVVAQSAPAWVQVTEPTSQAPVFSQVISPGQSHAFVVAQSATVETGSLGAHFIILEGLTTLTIYQPTKAPFTLTVNSVR